MPEPETVCSLCQMPAVRQDGQWVHAEAADAVFCATVMRGEPLDNPEDSNA